MKEQLIVVDLQRKFIVDDTPTYYAIRDAIIAWNTKNKKGK